jgi:TPP-dependent pyruvate/acetoin dehydrogenase alpha subunit
VTTQALMAELFGKTTGCCKGYGGSMHVGDIRVGALPAIAIVGGGAPIATGCALAFRYRKEPRVAVCFLGDGAVNEGVFHEAVNMAAIWDLPIVYVIENNFYGASTPVSQVTRVERLSDRAAAYGIPGRTIDGNDVLAVYDAAGEAIARARAGGGAMMLECLTYRRCGHSRSDGNAYRDPVESQQWLARDPIELFARKLIADGVLTEKGAAEADERVKEEIAAAVEFAEQSPEHAPDDALRNVFCEGED